MKARVFIIALFVALLHSVGVGAQQRLSVDVEEVSVAGGQKVTVTRSIFLHPDGRMVVEQHRPDRNICITNALGEMQLYTPRKNEVVVVNGKEVSSGNDLVAIFASGAYVDMGLPLYGYTQSGVRREEGLTIKTFEPKGGSREGAAKVELVFQNQLPICMVYYDGSGKTLRKLYFSRYEYGQIALPMRVTEVEYTSPTDSLVRLSRYSNLRFGSDATSEMFDFQVPADAVRVALPKMNNK